MAGASFQGDGPVAAINVTPLVDVMLVLLVIFMVTAPLLQQGVEVNLPKATTAPVKGSTDQVVLSIDKAGELYIGKGNKVPIAELSKKMAAVMAARADKDQKVFIQADTDLQYGKVMQVMSKLYEGGITQIGLISAPTDAG